MESGFADGRYYTAAAVASMRCLSAARARHSNAAMDLAALFAPLDPSAFKRDYFGRRPMHLPCPPGVTKPLLDWPRLSALLGLASHWTDGALTLILNARPVAPDHYMVSAAGARRADPARVEMFLGMGASLVANDVELIAPELRRVSDALAAEFGALVNANVYASFKGVQGFATHYDVHDVIVVQCAGDKVWTLYANRAEHPVEPVAHGGAEAQAIIDVARGSLAGTVRMRPGDLLYLPRGVYHDALAVDGPSLHVTFAVAPHGGGLVLQLLDEAARREPALRAYLTDGRTEPELLDVPLAAFAARLSAIVTSRGFRDAVVDAQRTRPGRSHAVRLPDAPALQSYMRTAQAGRIERDDDGAKLVTAGGRHALGAGVTAADYMLGRPGWSVQEIAARFGHIPVAERTALIDLLRRERLIAPYSPSVA